MTEARDSQHTPYAQQQDRWAVAHTAAMIALAILGLVATSQWCST